MATLLVAREVPRVGGDTMFSSGVAAFAALSEGMQRLLTPLRAVNSSSKADVSKTREDRIKDSGTAQARQVFEASHPGGTHPSRNGCAAPSTSMPATPAASRA
jgi:taurine dioxygenase